LRKKAVELKLKVVVQENFIIADLDVTYSATAKSRTHFMYIASPKVEVFVE